MSIRKFGHAEQIEAWSKKMGEIMEEMIRREFVQFRDEGTWQPATNVYETKDLFLVCVAVAGMVREQIDVQSLDDRRLEVSGERLSPRCRGFPAEVCIHVMEIDEGRFRRLIELPEAVDVSRVEAWYDTGYLWVRLPKREPEK